MIKAIIFDCYGVLTTDGWQPFKQKYFFGNPKLLDKASELNKQANSQVISYDEFLEKIGNMVGITATEARNIINKSKANNDLLNYIKRLKTKYKIGMLSNVSGNFLSQLFNEDQIKLFDKVVLSYDIGIPKPNVKAYQRIAYLLGIESSEAIFIDDQQKHVEGAQKAGMKAIVYQDFKHMKTELETLLLDSTSSDN